MGLSKEELQEHGEELPEKAGTTKDEFDQLLATLFENITIIEDKVAKVKMKEAKKAMDHIDANDTPFIALALAIENDGIWSEDRHFYRQNRIRVWKTRELTKMLTD